MAQAREREYAEPVFLVDIELLNSGPTLYFSDRLVTVGAQAYEDYVDDLSGLGDELRRQDSGALNADFTIRLRNDRYRTYEHLITMGDTYPFDGAEVTVKETYLDSDGTPSAAETLFKGVIDNLRNIDLLWFEARVSSRPFHDDRKWKQNRVDKDTYASALEDVGRLIPFVYGDAGRITALRTDWGARTTLKVDLNDSQTTGIELSDSARFPSSGSIYVDDEKISYTSITNSILGGVTRGAGSTTARPHGKGAIVWEDPAPSSG
jgi:hypothetical protein